MTKEKNPKKNNEAQSHKNQNNALNEEIKLLRTQITLLSELVINICSILDCNAEKKKEISEQLQLYKNLITSPIQ